MQAVVILMKQTDPFGSLSEDAYGLLLGTLRCCCVMLVCSLAVLIHIETLSPRTYALYRLAAALQSESGVFLLCGNFAALWMERLHRR